jgi:nucleoside-diphosphate-sugar epimerase
LTGAAGFIGAFVARRLLQDGCRVVGIDNLNDYYDVRLKQHRLDELVAMGLEYQTLDIEDRAKLEPLFETHPFDAVINLAARAGVRYSVINPHVYFTTNALGNLNLLECARHHGVRKFILASTSSLYAGQPMPFREDLPVNEPISPYAASKKAAEVTCYTHHKLFDLDVSIVRFFTVYGPAGRPDMSIFRFIRWIDNGEPIQLFGDGQQARDFTYVDDIARGVIAALAPTGYQIVNLGGGQNPITMLEVISQLERLLGKKAKLEVHPAHAADLTATWADISKAYSLWNWQPTTSLADGLAQSVQWYRQHRALACAISVA